MAISVPASVDPLVDAGVDDATDGAPADVSASVDPLADAGSGEDGMLLSSGIEGVQQRGGPGPVTESFGRFLLA
jgi:hypothetical protein